MVVVVAVALEARGRGEREETRRGGGSVCVGGARFMRTRSLKAIDTRIPTMPGWFTCGFRRLLIDRDRLHQARSAVRCLASRMKGELHPTKNHL